MTNAASKSIWPLAVLGLIALTAGTAHAKKRAVISFDGVEIYSSPSVDDSPLTVLFKGDSVDVLNQRGDWVKVEFAKDRQGWMQLQLKGPDRGPENGVQSPAHAGLTDVMPRPKSISARLDLQKADFRRPEPEAVAVSDIDVAPVPEPEPPQSTIYGRFGYAFSMGIVQADYTYNWRFLYHSTPGFALGGSFKHILGNTSDSYLMMASAVYVIDQGPWISPYLNFSVGVITTDPKRDITLGTVSHMAGGYGFGIRKRFRRNISFTFDFQQFTALVSPGTYTFRELTFGLLVGRFWD